MKPARYSEDKLMMQFRKGDRAALEKVYTMWYSDLCYFAYRIINNLAEAEDIAAATLHTLLSRHDKFEGLMNVRAFLFVTVRNKCQNYLQFIKRKNDTHTELSEIQGDTENYILLEIIQGELIKEIHAEIERLPVKRKQVLKLFYIEGLEVSDIAKKLKMTPGAVSTNKTRALDQLRTVVFAKRLLLPVSSVILLFKQFINSSTNVFRS